MILVEFDHQTQVDQSAFFVQHAELGGVADSYESGRGAARGVESVPLRDELTFIDDYLAIEMVRFGDKLKFVKEIEAVTLDRQFPSMLLQPIVENSNKHGLASKIEGGANRVWSRVADDGRLHILIEDDGVGIP